MVLSVTAPLWSDVSDRTSRKLGRLYVTTCSGQAQYELNSAENLALLTSVSPWWACHRQGRVLMYDDFEGTLGWYGGGASVTKDSTQGFVHQGTSAMKMVTGVVAGASISTERWIQPIFINLNAYCVLELYWALSAALDTTPRDFFVTWILEDLAGNDPRMFGMRYLHSLVGVGTYKIQYWTSAGAWADALPPFGVRSRVTTPQWHHWAIVVAHTQLPQTNKYQWLWHDQQIYQMAGTQGQVIGAGGNDQDIVVGCTTDAAAATTAYVDDFLVMDEVFTTDF